ncbi:conserved hypothetical protein [Desulfarculales bacterium]
MAQTQLVKSDKYGTLKVIQSYHEGPRIVHRLENGAYVFDTGLPVTDKSDLRKCIPVKYLQTALDWFDNKRGQEENPPRAIKVLPDNRVVFEDDGTEVTNIQDIVSYWEPGPFREAAMIAFADKLKRDKEDKGPMGMGPKASPKKKAPPPRKAAPKAVAQPPAVTT